MFPLFLPSPLSPPIFPHLLPFIPQTSSHSPFIPTSLPHSPSLTPSSPPISLPHSHSPTSPPPPFLPTRRCDRLQINDSGRLRALARHRGTLRSAVGRQSWCIQEGTHQGGVGGTRKGEEMHLLILRLLCVLSVLLIL